MSKKPTEQQKAPTILIAGRLALLGLALCAASFLDFFSHNHVPVFIFAALGALFAVNLALVLWFKISPSSPYLVSVQAALDLSIITAIIFSSGGVTSPYIFLYVPFVFLIRLFSDLKAALIVSTAAILAYCISSYFSSSATQDSFTEVLLTQNAILMAALSMVLIGTEHLLNLISGKEKQLQESKQDLELQNENQIALITKLPQSVVSFDSDYKLMTSNRRAQEFFGLSENQAAGLDLPYLLSKKLDKEIRFVSARDGSVRFEKAPDSISYDFLSVGSDKNRKMFLIFESIETELNQDCPGSQQLEEQLRELLISQPDTVSGSFIAESKIMKKVFSLIERAAPADATILINGESGTGKELVAKALHNKSSRKNSTFVSVNCGAIPEALLESTFFGHKKGAFTGAVSDSQGLFREADGGSLFLDEIGELPMHMQSKLLRVLQEKKVRPVGAERDYDIDIRVIAATNRNLKESVAKGEFRDDLFYRLNVINIVLPALRERRDDLPILIYSFLNKLGTKTKIPYNLNISSDALQLLLTYSYPGNVRELENILERAFVLGSGTILSENLQDLLPKKETVNSTPSRETSVIVNDALELPLNLDQVLMALEKKYMLLALEQTGGHRTKAADMLGINLRSFRYRAQKLGIKE